MGRAAGNRALTPQFPISVIDRVRSELAKILAPLKALTKSTARMMEP